MFFRDERKKIIQDLPVALSPCEGKRKRRRPPHYKIGFADLARTIAARWKSIDVSLKAQYEILAQAERDAYKEQMAHWREQQQTLTVPTDLLEDSKNTKVHKGKQEKKVPKTKEKPVETVSSIYCNTAEVEVPRSDSSAANEELDTDSFPLDWCEPLEAFPDTLSRTFSNNQGISANKGFETDKNTSENEYYLESGQVDQSTQEPRAGRYASYDVQPVASWTTSGFVHNQEMKWVWDHSRGTWVQSFHWTLDCRGHCHGEWNDRLNATPAMSPYYAASGYAKGGFRPERGTIAYAQAQHARWWYPSTNNYYYH